MIDFTFRSLANGNCMCSSISSLLVGNNSLVKELRRLTSIELYLHSEFYGKHCCFESAELSQNNTKKPIKSFFYLSLKPASVDLVFKNFSDAVKHEVILNCISNKWCSFMCYLGHSSVIKSQIHSSRYWGFKFNFIYNFF